MTLKSKLIATISAFCLVVGMLILGVWASSLVQVEMGGDLIFTATDVNVRVSGKIEGMETTEDPKVMNLPTITFSANPDENSPSTVLDQWKNNALTFTQTGDDITITITIENLSDRIVNVKVKDSVGASAGIDKIIKNGTTIESVAEVASGAEVSLNGNSITYYTITLSLKDRNNSLATGVKYGYTIDLSDSSYVAPREPVTSNDELLGTVEYTIDEDAKTIDVIAKPNDGCLLLGYENLETNQIEYVNNVNYEAYDFVFMLNNYWGGYLSSNKYNEFLNNYLIDSSILTEILAHKSDIISSIENDISMGNASQQNLDYAKNKFDEIENGVVNLKIDYVTNPNYKVLFINKNNVKEKTVGDYKYDYYKDVNLAFIKEYVGSNQIIELPTSFENDSITTNVVGFAKKLNDLSGDNIFKDKVTEITIPSSLLLSDLTFMGNTTLNKVTISGVKNVGFCSFMGCSNLQNVTIKDGTTTIGDQAFGNCASLTSITIPNSVSSIGDDAFFRCSRLTEMIILATTPPTLSGTNAISSATTKIYIPAGTLSAYTTATNWSSFASKFVELSA